MGTNMKQLWSGHKSALSFQGCQLSRIDHETHAIVTFHSLSRHTSNFKNKFITETAAPCSSDLFTEKYTQIYYTVSSHSHAHCSELFQSAATLAPYTRRKGNELLWLRGTLCISKTFSRFPMIDF